jgi:predicted phage tail protein
MGNDGGLVEIRLHGALSAKYGASHRLAISSPREAIDAIDTNHPGFRRDFLTAAPRYGLYVDGEWLEEDKVDRTLIPHFPVQRELDICPIIEGRFVGMIAAGVTALTGGAITGVAATIIGGVIALGLMVGASMLLAPKTKKKPGGDDTKKDESSYMFSGPENVTEQGVAVPLVYGYVHCGSVVVSAGLEVSEIPISGATVSAAVSESSLLLEAESMPMAWLDEPPTLEPLPVPVPVQPDYATGRRDFWRPPNA